jgi:hypothetical protein
VLSKQRESEPFAQANLTFRVAPSARSDTKVRSFGPISCDAMAQGERRQSRDNYPLRLQFDEETVMLRQTKV